MVIPQDCRRDRGGARGIHLNRKSMLCSSSTAYSWRLMISIQFQKLLLAPFHQASVNKRARSFSITRSSTDDFSSKRRQPLPIAEPQRQFSITADELGENEDPHDEQTHEESLKASRSTKKRAIKREIEIQRRRKIGLANKGKIPWNKGRQHSPETRERIRRRTIEALRDPKVRKKMAESPRSHSDQSKAKIGLALKKIWSKRLESKILKERCYWAWAGAVAEAAQKGGLGQRELEWDSYEKMNSEILSHHLQWKTERERQKEIEKRRAERALKSKSEKPVDLSQRIQEVKRKKLKKSSKKPGERNSVVPTPKSVKLRAKFVKIHRKQLPEEPMKDHESGSEDLPAAEKWDLEFIKREKMRQSVSFADQILAIKKQRVGQAS